MPDAGARVARRGDRPLGPGSGSTSTAAPDRLARGVQAEVGENSWRASATGRCPAASRPCASPATRRREPGIAGRSGTTCTSTAGSACMLTGEKASTAATPRSPGCSTLGTRMVAPVVRLFRRRSGVAARGGGRGSDARRLGPRWPGVGAAARACRSSWARPTHPAPCSPPAWSPDDLLHAVGTTQVLAARDEKPEPDRAAVDRLLGVGPSYVYVTHNPVGGAASTGCSSCASATCRRRVLRPGRRRGVGGRATDVSSTRRSWAATGWRSSRPGPPSAN